MTSLFCVGNELAIYKSYRLEQSVVIEATVLDDQQTKELYARTMPTMPAQGNVPKSI